jgi:N6-adenosine-specific RNA methylase IME4
MGDCAHAGTGFRDHQGLGFPLQDAFRLGQGVRHNVGFYNSVRAELLIIATRGSCTPDTGKLIDSVQTIERSDRHSEKPEEFYTIIDAMYDHGRKLELFSRKPRLGWDSDGNEADLKPEKLAA